MGLHPAPFIADICFLFKSKQLKNANYEVEKTPERLFRYIDDLITITGGKIFENYYNKLGYLPVWNNFMWTVSNLKTYRSNDLPNSSNYIVSKHYKGHLK